MSDYFRVPGYGSWCRSCDNHHYQQRFSFDFTIHIYHFTNPSKKNDRSWCLRERTSVSLRMESFEYKIFFSIRHVLKIYILSSSTLSLSFSFSVHVFLPTLPQDIPPFKKIRSKVYCNQIRKNTGTYINRILIIRKTSFLYVERCRFTSNVVVLLASIENERWNKKSRR